MRHPTQKPKLPILPFEELNILREKTDRVAQEIIDKAKDINEKFYIRFRLGAEYYGLIYEHTQEIIRQIQLTKLPHTPAFIAGVIHKRGALIAVLDLKQFFHLEPTPGDSNAYIIIAQSKKMTVGILADDIGSNQHYHLKTLDPPLLSMSSIKKEYLLGIHSGHTALLNMDTILADIQNILRASSPNASPQGLPPNALIGEARRDKLIGETYGNDVY